MTNPVFRHVRKTAKKRLLALSYLSVCLSVYVKQLGPAGRIFMKLDISLYFSIFRKSAEILNFH